MRPFRNGGIWRDWMDDVRIGWRFSPAILFCVLGVVVTVIDEKRLKDEQEKAELREMIMRIDERTEILERSCKEVCGD